MQAVQVLGRGLIAHQDTQLTVVLALLRLLRGEHNLTRGRTSTGAGTAAQDLLLHLHVVGISCETK